MASYKTVRMTFYSLCVCIQWYNGIYSDSWEDATLAGGKFMPLATKPDALMKSIHCVAVVLLQNSRWLLLLSMCLIHSFQNKWTNVSSFKMTCKGFNDICSELTPAKTFSFDKGGTTNYALQKLCGPCEAGSHHCSSTLCTSFALTQ